jgi:hypothetical protein
MEAEHYFAAKATGATRWAVIPDLGRTLSGLALMPYTVPAREAELSYRVKLSHHSDSIRLRMIFNSTLPFKKGGQSVAAAFDGGPVATWNINDQLTWQNNYSKMYPAAGARIIETTVTLALPSIPDDVYTLMVRPLDPGIVFYKIIVDDGGYEPSFLKMPESSFQKQ